MPLMAEMLGTGLTGSGSHPFCLFIDGLDVLKQPGSPGGLFGVDIRSVELSESLDGPPVLRFVIDDPSNVLTPNRDANVYFCDHQGMQYGGTYHTDDLFRGTISQRELITPFPDKKWQIEAVGLQAILDDRVIPRGVFGSLNVRTAASIQQLMAYYGDPRISFLAADPTSLYATPANGGVLLGTAAPPDTGNNVMGGSYASVSVTGKTLRQAIAALMGVSSKSQEWIDNSDAYPLAIRVNSQGRLTVGTTTTELLPVSTIVEGTGASTSYGGPHNLRVQEDRSDVVNAVYVNGVDAASSGWVVNQASIDTYGRIERILDEPRSVSSVHRDAYGGQYLAQHVASQRIGFYLESSRTSLYPNRAASTGNGWHIRHSTTLQSGSGYFSDITTAVLASLKHVWSGTSETLHMTFQTTPRSMAATVSWQSIDALETSQAGGRLQGTLGEVAVRTKAGTPSDADFDIARDGFMVIDTTRAAVWIRAGGTWHDAAASTPKVCIATRTATQSITTATHTALDFTAADVSDPFGFHDPASNSTRLTVPAGWAGSYLAIVDADFVSNATGIRLVSVTVNGAAPASGTLGNQVDASASAWQPLHAIVPLELAVGDYVEFKVWQNSGGNLNIEAGALGTLVYLGETA